MQTIEELIKNPTTKNILETAQTLFLERGFSQVEMKDIAARCNIARSTLYRYFSSKELLAFHLSLYIFRTRPLFYNGPLPDGTGYERLIFALHKSIDILSLCRADLAYLTQFDVIYSGKYPDSDIAQVYETAMKEHPIPFLPLILEGIEDKSICPLDNPELAAHTLCNTLLAMAQRIFPREDHLRKEHGYGAEMLYYLVDHLLLRQQYTLQGE